MSIYFQRQCKNLLQLFSLASLLVQASQFDREQVCPKDLSVFQDTWKIANTYENVNVARYDGRLTEYRNMVVICQKTYSCLSGEPFSKLVAI